MSTSNNVFWQNGQTGAIALLLIILLAFVLLGGRHFFHNTRQDLKTTFQDAGHDLKSTGRDAAASIRDTVQ